MLLQKIKRASQSSLLLHRQGEWRRLTRGWPDPHQQHDVAEFLMHLLHGDPSLQALSERFTFSVEIEGAPRFDEGRGVILVPVRNDAGAPFAQLQDSVKARREQLQLHVIRQGTELMVLQLNRFLRRGPFASKDTSPVGLMSGLVMLPAGMPDDVAQRRPYNVVSLITHVGAVPTSGHYRAVLFNAGDMRITDDNKRAVKVCAADRVQERAYLVMLRKAHDAGDAIDEPASAVLQAR